MGKSHTITIASRIKLETHIAQNVTFVWWLVHAKQPGMQKMQSDHNV